ncbi:DNA adenine methylase [Mesonia sp. HuA40]|uniref:DNA adenine methylase n=1 Tax=Mesonia sp. HuA40 TaxID=2602761 RepID=UPI0011CB0F19|nr:DNA adenine methylase [Mesonia sp. HuA40]TXK72543.1 modification methylase [Mesonia sp. HuA40]
MNYIGSKNRLSAWIVEQVKNTVEGAIDDMILCDLFAGTGRVGRSFKPLVKQIIANDVEYYSYVLLQNYIGNHQEIPRKRELIESLQQATPVNGFIAEEYGENGSGNRLFFTQANAQKIDGMRLQLQQLESQLDASTYFFLLASLLESADKVANTASVYGAFLKKIKKSAAKPLVLEPADFDKTTRQHQVFQEDANVLIKRISGDILYLDPPYNARQYGANYHLLNTIARYDRFEPKGKTGLREYYKSNYCKKSKVAQEFEALIAQANFNYIFLSYNNEGLMPSDQVKEIMQKYGTYRLVAKQYQRFKADKTQNRNHKATATEEYLHILVK